MRRVICLALLLLIRSAPVAAASEPQPVVADTTDAAAGHSRLLLSLDEGEELVAARVEPGGPDYVRVTLLDGRVSYIPAYRFRSIEDSEGKDWTHHVLVRRKSVGSVDGIPGARAHHGLALIGRPIPETKAFIISQIGLLAYTNAGTSSFTKGDAILTGDFGFMRNVSRRVAVGANVYLGGDDYRFRLGPKARVRYWASRIVSVDVAPGLFLGHEWGEFPGFVGEVSVNFDDILMLSAELETIGVRSQGVEQRDTSLYLGGKIGGPPGLIGVFAGVLLLGVYSAGGLF